jgi:positive regulator of sigma E activity
MSEDPDATAAGYSPPLLQRLARVEAVIGHQARVASDRMSGCGGCSQRSGCGHAAVNGDPSPLNLTVENTLGARVGDWVVIGMPAAGLLGAMGWAYGLPLGGFLAGVLAGSPLGSTVAAICGAAGLAAGAWVGRRRFASRRANDQDTGEPRMVRLADPPDDAQCNSG